MFFFRYNPYQIIINLANEDRKFEPEFEDIVSWLLLAVAETNMIASRIGAELLLSFFTISKCLSYIAIIWNWFLNNKNPGWSGASLICVGLSPVFFSWTSWMNVCGLTHFCRWHLKLHGWCVHWFFVCWGWTHRYGRKAQERTKPIVFLFALTDSL